MSSLLKLIFCLLVTATINGHATELTLTTDDGFDLKTDYFAAPKESSRAVLLLHQCNLTYRVNGTWKKLANRRLQLAVMAATVDVEHSPRQHCAHI